MMTKRVKEILSHYPGENAGVLTNLARMMMSGRLAYGTCKLAIPLLIRVSIMAWGAVSLRQSAGRYDPAYHLQPRARRRM